MRIFIRVRQLGDSEEGMITLHDGVQALVDTHFSQLIYELEGENDNERDWRAKYENIWMTTEQMKELQL